MDQHLSLLAPTAIVGTVYAGRQVADGVEIGIRWLLQSLPLKVRLWRALRDLRRIHR